VDHLKTGDKENWRSSSTEGKLESSLFVKDEFLARYSQWIPFHFSFRGKDFLPMAVREESGPWHFWTYRLGTQDKMSTFIANLKLWNPDATDEVCCRTSVISIDKSVEDVIANKEAFTVTDAVICRIRRNDEVHFEVSLTSI
jgi:hypothetical protein